jgi:TP901-1 family phage major tail protein
MAKIAGVDVLVYVEGQTAGTFIVLGGQSDATLNREAEEIEVTSKDGNGWAEYLAGVRSWSVECEGFIVENDAALDILETKFNAGDPVNLEVRLPGNKTYEGSAYITDFPLEFPQDDGATYSLTFTGSGPLTKTTGA